MEHPRLRRFNRGQASVEVVALLPTIVVAALLGWWAVAVAHEWVIAAGAARSAARAHEVGAPSDAAARRVLGPRRAARHTLERRVAPDGALSARVTLRLPGALPDTRSVVVRGVAAHTVAVGAP